MIIKTTRVILFLFLLIISTSVCAELNFGSNQISQQVISDNANKVMPNTGTSSLLPSASIVKNTLLNHLLDSKISIKSDSVTQITINPSNETDRGSVENISSKNCALSNGILYYGSYEGNYGKIFALNAKTGKIIWEYTTAYSVHLTFTPTIVDGIVYFGSEAGLLLAFDAKTGKKKWEYDFYDTVSTPVIVNGVAYCSGNMNITALNAKTGKIIWIKTMKEWRYSSNPVVENGMLYVNYANSGTFEISTYAFDTRTGKQKWIVNNSGHMHNGIMSSEVIDNNILVFSGESLCCLDAKTGKQKWMNYAISYSYYEGKIFISQYQNSLVYCLDVNTGNQLKNYIVANAIENSQLTVANGMLYVMDNYNHNLHAIELISGKEKWACQPNVGYGGTISYISKNILYFNGGNNIFAFNAKTGKKLWTSERFDPGIKYILPHSIKSNNMLFAYGVLGSLIDPHMHAINATTGKKIWTFPSN